MKSINEFLNNTGVDEILLEALSNTTEYTDAEIFESLDILFEAANTNELHPKTGEEVVELLDVKQHNLKETIIKLSKAYNSWCDANTIDYDRVPARLFDYDHSGKYINYDNLISGIVLDNKEFEPMLEIFPENKTLKKIVNEKDLVVLREKSRGERLEICVIENKNYTRGDIIDQTTADGSRPDYHYKYDFSKSFIDNVFMYILGPDFNMDELKDGEQNPHIQRGRDLKNKKAILTELCKVANVTGDQLLKVIKKCTEDRELTEETITGLSMMICGALTCMRNGGKGDKKAVGALCERILKIVNNPKTGLRYILK